LKSYIVFLRGINVGGKRKLPMKSLQSWLAESKDYQAVKSYLQTGNVLLKTTAKSPKALEDQLEKLLQSKMQDAPTVLARTVEDYISAIENRPFQEQALEKSYLCLLKSADYQGQQKPSDEVEKWEWRKGMLFLYYPNGYGRSKRANNYWERQLKMPCTSRNYKTCLHLLALAKSTYVD